MRRRILAVCRMCCDIELVSEPYCVGAAALALSRLAHNIHLICAHCTPRHGTYYKDRTQVGRHMKLHALRSNYILIRGHDLQCKDIWISIVKDTQSVKGQKETQNNRNDRALRVLAPPEVNYSGLESSR